MTINTSGGIKRKVIGALAYTFSDDEMITEFFKLKNLASYVLDLSSTEYCFESGYNVLWQG